MERGAIEPAPVPGGEGVGTTLGEGAIIFVLGETAEPMVTGVGAEPGTTVGFPAGFVTGATSETGAVVSGVGTTGTVVSGVGTTELGEVAGVTTAPEDGTTVAGATPGETGGAGTVQATAPMLHAPVMQEGEPRP